MCWLTLCVEEQCSYCFYCYCVYQGGKSASQLRGPIFAMQHWQYTPEPPLESRSQQLSLRIKTHADLLTPMHFQPCL